MRWLIFAAMVGAASAGVAAPPKQRSAPPPAFQKLVDCRDIADPGQRLSCFDREVAAVAAAESRQDLVVIDRAKVRTARKTLFGLQVPDLGIFGGGDEEEGVSRIETTIAGATRNADGRWALRLADGARWLQADSRDLARDPRAGHKIAIRKAALGSFLANIDGQIAIRVRRLN